MTFRDILEIGDPITQSGGGRVCFFFIFFFLGRGQVRVFSAWVIGLVFGGFITSSCSLTTPACHVMLAPPALDLYTAPFSYLHG